MQGYSNPIRFARVSQAEMYKKHIVWKINLCISIFFCNFAVEIENRTS